jgi:diguanylate cyclase (GGDEF)-like protein
VLLGWIACTVIGVPESTGEVLLWCMSIAALVAPLQVAILVSLAHQLEEARSRLERMASTDMLTQTYNRRAFDARLMEAFSHARSNRSPLSVLMIDVDHFKSVNDRFGHAGGDMALFTVAERCRVALRHGDVLARYGGEEFAVMLPESSPERAVEVAERLRRAVAQAQVAQGTGQNFGVTVSVGVSALDAQDRTPEDLLRRADARLYQAKAAGRNRCLA